MPSPVMRKSDSRKATCRRGSEAWQLVDGLRHEPDDTFITEKNTYDAFQNTSLESLLRRWDVDTVIVGGVVTNLCCDTTARCVSCCHRLSRRRGVSSSAVLASLYGSPGVSAI